MEFIVGILLGCGIGVAGHALIVGHLKTLGDDIKAEIAKLEAAIKAKV